jgi:hypothetical protein
VKWKIKDYVENLFQPTRAGKLFFDWWVSELSSGRKSPMYSGWRVSPQIIMVACEVLNEAEPSTNE